MQSVDLVAVLFFDPHSLLLSAFLHSIPDPLTVLKRETRPSAASLLLRRSPYRYSGGEKTAKWRHRN